MPKEKARTADSYTVTVDTAVWTVEAAGPEDAEAIGRRMHAACVRYDREHESGVGGRPA